MPFLTFVYVFVFPTVKPVIVDDVSIANVDVPDTVLPYNCPNLDTVSSIVI